MKFHINHMARTALKSKDSVAFITLKDKIMGADFVSSSTGLPWFSSITTIFHKMASP